MATLETPDLAEPDEPEQEPERYPSPLEPCG
jgi:hypothetical protein